MIVITGYGIKAPKINGKQQFQEILENGICTLGVCRGLGPDETDIVCGQIQDNFYRIDGQNYKNYPRVARLALAAAVDAVNMAGFRVAVKNKRVAVIAGTSAGGLIDIEKGVVYSSSGNNRKFPLLSGLSNFHSVSSAITAHFGLNGMTMTVTTGCTASTEAIILGKLLLETGQADMCIVGGADAPITPYSVYSFNKLKGLSTGADIMKCGNPFSSDSEGFVLAEGAAMLVLERLDDVEMRGAPIYGIVERGVANNDGVSIYESDLSGKWMEQAMNELLGMKVPTYVNSQALGLSANDGVERTVHRQLLGWFGSDYIDKRYDRPFVRCGGSHQTISALISMEKGFIPPTTRSTGLGFEDLPIVFETVYKPIHSVAVTSHGLGGNNACLLLSKY